MMGMLRWICLMMLLLSTTTPNEPPVDPPKALVEHRSFIPVVVKRAVPPPPSASESRYISKTAPTTLRNYGCKQAQAMQPDQNGFVVLLFGQPWYNAERQEYGTNLPIDGNTFASIREIEAAAKYWADGFWECTPVQNSPAVILAVGTSNFGPAEYVTAEHGREWALMVNRVGSYLNEQNYLERITIAGASNIELNWNKPDVTRSWVDGYDEENEYVYYNIGACEGCPYEDHPDWRPDNDWTLEDIWYVSWQVIPARPFPQIYSPTAAKQWQFLAKWGKTNLQLLNNIKYYGALTQYQACLDQDDTCAGTKNTPSEGWTQFWTELNKDPDTQQDLQWSSDIRWNQ